MGRVDGQEVEGLTVGTYSLGNLFVVYEIKRHVCGAVLELEPVCYQSPTHLPNSTIAHDNTLDRLHAMCQLYRVTPSASRAEKD